MIKKVVFAFGMCLTLKNLHSQAPADFVSLQNFTPPSPEASAINRYGDIPVDLSSGLVQIAVPIYEIKSKKLTIPVSLSYHASGIKVQDMATPVGLGWVLNAGGSVSRNVVGKADENGMLTGTPGAYFRDVSSLANSTYTTSNNTDFSYLANMVNSGFDVQSDIYNFNVPGLSGKFVYDQNFTIQYQPVDKQLIIQRTNGNKFIITDDAGNVYKFMETEVTEGYSSADITTWHLTEIASADNSDIVTFEYIAGATLSDPETSYSFYINVPPGDGANSICAPQPPSSGLSESTVPYFFHRKLLSRINFEGGYVKFEYINDREDPAPERLDMVKIYRTDNSLIKQIKLNQDYFTSEGAPATGPDTKYYKRLKLNEVEFKAADNITKNRYSFDYNYVGAFPPYRIGGINGKKSVSIDYWGYFNGGVPPGAVSTLIPAGLENQITGFIVSAYGNANNSTPILSQYQNLAINRGTFHNIPECTLKKIYYPTGGNTEFEYEGNKIGNSGLPADNTGGYRIKKITTFDPIAQISSVKSYEYSVGEPVSRIIPYSFSYQTAAYTNRTSSQAPYYAWCTTPNFNITANPTSPINYYNGSPVIYSQVTEYEGTNTVNIGKTVYQFDTEPDGVISSPYWTKYTYAGADKSWARGGLLNQKVYNNISGNYSLIKEIVNTYSSLGQKSVKVGQICELVGGGTTANLENYLSFLFINNFPPSLLNYFDYADVILPFGTKKLIKTEEFDYLNSIVNNKKEFFFESLYHLYPSKVKNYGSVEGDVSVTEMRYPQDKAAITSLSGTAASALDGMIAANIKAPVIETKTFKNTTQLLRNLTEYKYWGAAGRYYPEFLSQQIGNNNLEQRVQFLSYDDKGNLTSQKKVGDVISSYIWGYNKMYPVASITGKSYDDAVSQSGIDLNVVNNPSSESALQTELNKLRTLSGALTTTFTYKPLSGISTQTDARGLRSYYEYDNFNRLSLIRDNSQKIIKRICYNFAGEQEDCSIGAPPPLVYYNVLASQTFTRNNCGACETGSQVTYTVLANTYSSFINQAAADQLAQNDIVANGQNYANTNGTCTPTGVNITYDNQTTASGYTATFTNINTNQVYTFNIPANSSGSFGCLPVDLYSLSISTQGISMYMQFSTGCHTVTGTSLYLSRVNVSSCNHITMSNFID